MWLTQNPGHRPLSDPKDELGEGSAPSSREKHTLWLTTIFPNCIRHPRPKRAGERRPYDWVQGPGPPKRAHHPRLSCLRRISRPPCPRRSPRCPHSPSPVRFLGSGAGCRPQATSTHTEESGRKTSTCCQHISLAQEVSRAKPEVNPSGGAADGTAECDSRQTLAFSPIWPPKQNTPRLVGRTPSLIPRPWSVLSTPNDCKQACHRK